MTHQTHFINGYISYENVQWFTGEGRSHTDHVSDSHDYWDTGYTLVLNVYDSWIWIPIVLQVALRWGVQRQYAIVPKSVTPSRIKENFEVCIYMSVFTCLYLPVCI